MIVISFILVVVAFVLLVVGLVAQAVVPVYACIGTAVVAGIFLAIGVLQRRHDDTRRPAAGPAAVPAAPVGPPDVQQTVVASPASTDDEVAPDESSPDEGAWDDDTDVEEWDEELEYGGTVFIVEGRPRYHTEDCRYVSDRDDVEAIDVLDAVEEGFTSCGVCRPDEVLAELKADLEAEQAVAAPTAGAPAVPAAAAAPEPLADRVVDDDNDVLDDGDEYDDDDYDDDEYDEDEDYEEDFEDEGDDVEQPPVAVPPHPAGPAGKAGPAKAAVAAAAAASSSPAKSMAQLVVIPDGNKFHRSDCRYVRNNPDAATITRATARRRGYTACGLCRP